MSIFTIDKFSTQEIAARAEYHESGDESHLVVNSGREDYYMQPGSDTVLAAFVGQGAAHLNLGHAPRPGDYAALMQGINPRTQNSYCSKSRHTQLHSDNNALAGYSTSFNVEKSLSLLYATLPRNQQEVFERGVMEAARRTLGNLESRGLFAFRTGSQGSETHPGEIVAATYLHFTNRNQEPHLHAHAEIPNLVVGADGNWRTLDARELYRRQVEIAALFDTFLASALLRDLPEIVPVLEHDPDRSGLVVAGIGREEVMKFSSRRREIQQALQEMGADGADAARAAAKRTRQAKAAVDGLTLRKEWQTALATFSPKTGDLTPPTKLALEALLFKNNSVFRPHDLDRVAAQLSILHGGADAIPEIKAAIYQQLGVIRLPDQVGEDALFTTEEFRQFEMDVLRFARHSQKPAPHFSLTQQQIEAALVACERERGFKLRDEQVQAMRHAADGRRMTIIQGAAGTGKSASLAALNLAYNDVGNRVLGLAPSGAAAAELEKSSGIASRTIHALLIMLENDNPKYRLHLKDTDVIVVDEAGMVDTRTLHKLASFVEQAGAKLVLVGDSKQLEAVGSASTLHMLTQHLGAGRLEQIARQRDSENRAISQAWFLDGGDALGLMETQGLVRATEPAAPSAIDRLMSDAARAHSAGTAWDEILLLADKNNLVQRLNHRVRELRIEAGELDPAAEQVVQVGNDRAHVRQISLAPGDRIMLRKNAKLGSTPIFNGDRATLLQMERVNVGVDASGFPIFDTRLRARLDRNGLEISWCLEDYDKLDHAYAMTVHKSQGLTVERAFYLAGETTDRRSAYVAFTRAREACPFYLDAESAAGFAERTRSFKQKTTALDADQPSKHRVLNESIRYTGQCIRTPQPDTKVLLEKAGERFCYPRESQSQPMRPRIELIDTTKAARWLAQSRRLRVTPLEDQPSDTRFKPSKPYRATGGVARLALQCEVVSGQESSPPSQHMQLRQLIPEQIRRLIQSVARALNQSAKVPIPAIIPPSNEANVPSGNCFPRDGSSSDLRS